jgi:hypothetical protein
VKLWSMRMIDRKKFVQECQLKFKVRFLTFYFLDHLISDRMEWSEKVRSGMSAKKKVEEKHFSRFWKLVKNNSWKYNCLIENFRSKSSFRNVSEKIWREFFFEIWKFVILKIYFLKLFQINIFENSSFQKFSFNNKIFRCNFWTNFLFYVFVFLFTHFNCAGCIWKMWVCCY